MTGRSGLRDFHGRPSDGGPDHPWIDREEAVRRIFAGELLFPPGEGEAHSHSAWGLLAVLDPYLESGDPVRFRLRRGGQELTVEVRPDRR